MAEEYKSVHTGLDIDAAVTRALPGGGIDQAMNAKPNPNLLDNAYFGNPVDQRGGTVVIPGVPYYSSDGSQAGTTAWYHKVVGRSSTSNPIITIDGANYFASYTYEVRGYTGAGYGIDRWKMASGVTNAVTVENDGLKATFNSAAYLAQIIENPAVFSGKTVTISALCGDVGNGLQLRIRANGAFVCNVACVTNGVANTTVTLPDNLTAMQLEFGSAPTAGYSANIKAAKMELGTEQTLAHQENGVWVLNEIPNYAEELAKCQRYQLALTGLARYRAIVTSADVIDFFIPTPATMRANPALVGINATLYNFSNGQAVSGFTYAVAAKSDNGVYIRATKAGHGLTDARINITAGLILDANL